MDELKLVRDGRDAGRERIKALVLASVTSPHSRRAYGRALDEFLAWSEGGPFTRALVQQYRATLEQKGLAPSSINLRLAAIRKLASEAADNGLLAAEQASAIARVRGTRRRGIRAGNWLTREQAQALLDAPDAGTVKGRRDRAVLALLIGCGLRRSEIAALCAGDIEQRDGRWAIVDLAGKGNRLRTVPVPAWVKTVVDEWTAAAVIREGRLFRSLNKRGDVWGDGITEKVVWWIVQEYARAIGVDRLAPHDLRRTCAKLCRAAGGDLEQIQFLLGHASIQTTERYLGSRQNLSQAVNDNLGLG
jgi:site-specific recombinase XerD